MKHFKKVALSGVLLVGTMLSASAVSAAPQTVQPGDLENIAKQYGVDLSSLLKDNPNLSKLIEIGIGKDMPFPCYPTPDQGNNQGSQPAPTQPDQGSQPAPTPAKPEQPAPSQPTTPTQPDQGNKPAPTEPSQGDQAEISDYAKQVADLVNEERAKAGLKPLTLDSALSAMALDKAKDMYHNNYFDHNSPTYGSPFDMMKTYGIKYSTAGENIAKGQRNPQEVMNAWMNSPGHKQNIMSPNFTTIGVAYYQGVWVQEFTG
ncbi:CAP domain-containing protein [Paenibacillus sp. J2TS4]|uniref:CAP domain-containing protein n=1 Tax=Paenibacillus sp. J2TS4 TaxID=2807194 RepID=UPI001B11AF68|nr:CAP domain-containing protein [Paenibacillus sp. J2TS4]GIP35247.1 hypothetical protein J2TS4_44570 [Paenibacillus sp. J2TS4]